MVFGSFRFMLLLMCTVSSSFVCAMDKSQIMLAEHQELLLLLTEMQSGEELSLEFETFAPVLQPQGPEPVPVAVAPTHAHSDSVLVCGGAGEWRMVTVQKSHIYWVRDGHMKTKELKCIVCLGCEERGKQKFFKREDVFKQHLDVYHKN